MSPSAAKRPQGVEDDRHVDDFLEQGALDRWEITEGGDDHRDK
jgi:hypothetical protein